MHISQITIKSFKTLGEATFNPGQVNVFVGANGSGKTTTLEAIGLVSAALTDRIDINSMNRKGIRLSVPRLYKSNFADLTRASPTIGFGIKWEHDGDAYDYSVNLNVPNEKEAAMRDTWRYHSEHITQNGVYLCGRSGASQTDYDPYIGLFLQELLVTLSLSYGIIVFISQTRKRCVVRKSIPIRTVPWDCAAADWRKPLMCF